MSSESEPEVAVPTEVQGRKSWTSSYLALSSDEQFKICRLCIEKKRVTVAKWQNKSSGVTGNVIKHLRSVHNITETGKLERNGPLDVHVKPLITQSEFNKVASLWIIKDGRPFTVGESLPFKEMIHAFKKLPRGSSFPSATTIKRNLETLHAEGVQKMHSMLESVDTRVHFTMDCWTSANMLDFCAFGIHFIDTEWKLHGILLDFVPMKEGHTADDLLRIFMSVADTYSLIPKLGCITADSASNNLSMCKKLQADVADFGGFTHIPCLAHVVNLAATDAITEFQPTIEKLRSYAVHIRSSTSRWKRYTACRVKEGKSGPHISLDTPTRWSSCHDMLERCIDHFEVLQRYETKSRSDKKKLAVLYDEDRASAKELCVFLSEFSDTTVVFSQGDELLSAAVIRFSILVDFVLLASEDPNLSEDLRRGAAAAHEKLSKYFVQHDAQVYYLATILDPRYKMRVYGRLEWAKEYLELAERFIADAIKDVSPIPSQRASQFERNPATSTQPTSRVSQILLSLDEDGPDRPDDELSLYLEEPILKNANTQDVLQYWKMSATRFPRLAKLAKEYISVPCASVDIERQFSSARHSLSYNRQSMEPETLQKLMCVKNWL